MVMPYEQLQFALRNQQVYEIEFESKKYQVEIEILENTEQYVRVMVAVDDGSLPASILPRLILSFATSQLRVVSGFKKRNATL